MGRVAGAYGVLGWVKVVAYSEEPGRLTGFRTWYLDGAPRSVESARVHSGQVVAKLASVDTREAAAALTGAEVAVLRSDLQDPGAGSFYWSDLIGLEVATIDGVPLGKVTALFSNGAHDVMEIEGPRQRLLPWIDSVIRKVDLDAGRIEVDWDADW